MTHALVTSRMDWCDILFTRLLLGSLSKLYLVQNTVSRMSTGTLLQQHFFASFRTPGMITSMYTGMLQTVGIVFNYQGFPIAQQGFPSLPPNQFQRTEGVPRRFRLPGGRSGRTFHCTSKNLCADRTGYYLESPESEVGIL